MRKIGHVKWIQNSINFQSLKNFFERNIFFRSFTNWYYFVSILLRILCWFRICNFLALKVWPKSQKLRFWARFAIVAAFFNPNRLVLAKATQGRYWAAMLGPVILCIYRKVPFDAGFAERSQELLYFKKLKFSAIPQKNFRIQSFRDGNIVFLMAA